VVLAFQAKALQEAYLHTQQVDLVEQVVEVQVG
jgi:hypothetical protein